MMGDKAKVIAEIDDPTIGRWMLNEEGMHEAGWVDDAGGTVRWDGFYGRTEVRVLAALLADAVRRLSERIEANEAEIAKTELKNTCEYGALRDRVKSLEEGEKDAITNQTGFADQLVALSERIDGIGQAVCDTRVEQGEVNLVTELDTRHAKRRLEELEERVVALEASSEKLREAGMNTVQGAEALVAFTDKLDDRVSALEGKPATGPLNDIANVARRAADPRHASDTVSEATRRYIRQEMAREIVAGLRIFEESACEGAGLAANWIQREYLRGEEDGDG